MRISITLLLVTCLSVAAFAQTPAAQQLTGHGEFVLPKGEISETYRWVATLPQGFEAELLDLDLVAAGQDELPEGISIDSASAKTQIAGYFPQIEVTFMIRRDDKATDDDLTLAGALTYQINQKAGFNGEGPKEPSTSVLAEGDVFKIQIDEDGIYRIDRALLESIGASVSSPAEVRLYSKGGAMLPGLVGAPYPTDLQEVALLESGNGDGTWDANEYLAFYGEGEDVWKWDSTAAGGEGDFYREENFYSESTYYYLKVGGSGLRMDDLASVSSTFYDDEYTARARHEVDINNLLRRRQQMPGFGVGQGGGQQWFGFEFNTIRTTTVSLALGEVVPGATGRLTAKLAGSAPQGSRFGITGSGANAQSSSIRSGNATETTANFANYGYVDIDYRAPSGKVEFKVDYPATSRLSRGWLDYVQVTHPAQLRLGNDMLRFSSNSHAAAGTYGYRLAAGAGSNVLDITDPLNPRRVRYNDAAGAAEFGYVLDSVSAPREFLAFRTPRAITARQLRGRVPNSNLHGVEGAEMLIVYADTLETSALRLAEHRRTHDGYRVLAAPMSAVAEEYGGGRPDPTAIRNLAASLRERDGKLRYLLLFGDGSYDTRGLDNGLPGLIPTYQTANEVNEVYAFPTDDYFALLDEGEGGRIDRSFPTGALDLGVGRIPAGGPRDAAAMVQKIIRYDTDPDMLGDWRLRTVYVADDEDDNRHIGDMDAIAERQLAQAPEFNQVKVYADAYQQLPTAGGTKIPGANEAINRNMFLGNLVMTYLGHGGPKGWAQERILAESDIEKWNNSNALPVLVTATCTFTGFDDPYDEVAGERVLFKRGGGAVASLSTTRPVFINANGPLTRATLDQMLNEELAIEFGLGELLSRAKNQQGTAREENSRKYALFGDPATKLAVPKLEVAVTQFDSINVEQATDSFAIAPLREVLVQGEVRNRDGSLASDFDGEVSLKAYDQDISARTLGNDSDSPVREFRRVGPLVFIGTASVTGGKWKARMMLPKDVSLSRGRGRLSLYAKSADGRDGSGLFRRFLVDGVASPAISDDEPPSVAVALDDLSFEPGGRTASDPVMIVSLADDTGINVSGASIGHDLVATLRGPTNDEYVLNSFYRAAPDDNGRGEVRFPLFDLPVGEYELTVRAWDLANNTGSATTTFLVVESLGADLTEVINFPNPFATSTCFAFSHSLEGKPLNISIDVFALTGARVRTIQQEAVADSGRFEGDECIAWDGTDDYGTPLPRGMYFYRISVVSEDGQRDGSSEVRRLVIER